MRDGTRPQRLQEIVAALHPWLRSRICTILISPVEGGGWDAALTYVGKTLPPPPDLQIATTDATDPIDTHHPLDLPPAGIETMLREQIRELAGIGELGTLHVEKLPFSSTTSGSRGGDRPADPHLSQPAWRLTTHAGLVHQRRTWLSRIGRRDFDRGSRSA